MTDLRAGSRADRQSSDAHFAGDVSSANYPERRDCLRCQVVELVPKGKREATLEWVADFLVNPTVMRHPHVGAPWNALPRFQLRTAWFRDDRVLANVT